MDTFNGPFDFNHVHLLDLYTSFKSIITMTKNQLKQIDNSIIDFYNVNNII